MLVCTTFTLYHLAFFFRIILICTTFALTICANITLDGHQEPTNRLETERIAEVDHSLELIL
jgi:hypothetical protein